MEGPKVHFHQLLFKDICFGEVIILEKKWLFTNYDVTFNLKLAEHTKMILLRYIIYSPKQSFYFSRELFKIYEF